MAARKRLAARGANKQRAESPVDAVKDAKAASLRYVSDEQSGLSRRRRGQGFVYLDARRRVVHDEATLARIRLLAIPPAWTDVWICPIANGHLQATGRDARGRKQYRYHARWREIRDEAKYEHMVEFAALLPRLRRRVKRDLQLPGMPRSKVLATLVQLLEGTMMRVGNEEYARANHSFGLTTLRDRHANIRGSTIHFHFRGKSGKEHEIDVTDPHLARIVQRCQDLPGHELFQYRDENGDIQSVGSADVNEYVRELTGQDFTAKDFRTWAGTVLAAQALCAAGACRSATHGKRAVKRAIEQVAQRLGNTPTICRKCYVHPAVIEAYLDGSIESLAATRRAATNGEATARRSPKMEKMVRKFLASRLPRKAATKAK